MPRSSRARQNDFYNVCSRCRTRYSCCLGTLPPITSKRKSLIEDYLKREKIRIEDAFVKAEYVFPRVKKDGYCIFHDEKTKKCLIHPAKPETCVAGPITFDINTQNGKIEWYIKMEKICQLAGIVFEDKETLRKHLESAKKELLRLVNELGSEELKAILQKDEPETFKIDEDSIEENVLDKLTSGS